MRFYFFLISLMLPIFSIAQVQIGSDIDGEAEGDWSGRSLSLSSDGLTLAIGAPRNDGNGENAGHVRVLQYISGSWIQIGDDIDGEAADDGSGFSVSLSSDGNIVAVGAPSNDGNGEGAGHVRVYEYASGTWNQVGDDIDGESAGDQSGYSVSLSADGTILAIGARRNDGSENTAGHVRIFQNIAGDWTQIGADIDGEAAYDNSGYSVSLSADGNIVAIGAPLNDGTVFGSNSGHVRVYENIAGAWEQLGNDIDGEAIFNNQSGSSVSLSANGNVVAIGAPLNASGTDGAGQVRVYHFISGSWTQVGEQIDGENAEDKYGDSVALSGEGTLVAAGGRLNSGNGLWAGHARVHRNIDGVWTQAGNDIDGEAPEDLSGSCVALSTDGKIIAVGAYRNDGNGNEAGHVKVYHLAGALSTNDFVPADFSVYPNPSSDFVTVLVKDGLRLVSVNIYSSTGRLIKTADNAVIPVNGLARGAYLLEVTTNAGATTKTIIID
jgi:hypothetical protein